ncbi:glycoside hydrolase family 2 TIM barrel-domain containing protein [Brevundimonas sp. G8]|uniref:glycoside hydrolase family 2 TIM barrel-domain containing protein n=1 Tax=Brevundimonas sp. G8 TaxID=1350776 RepID=UPI0012F41A4E|nr:glycoside hydrolase family 2 TIM barrel-domain containing protein [Brevundimonas sp. G8]VXB23292.1 Beta-galactosidase [Brevundimonas sp. G8]
MKRYSAIAAGLLVLPLASPVLAEASAAAQAEQRDVIPLATGWRFQFGEAPESVVGDAFDDSGWQAVEVPHTWNRVGYYLNNHEDRIHTPETVNREQGVGWYRLHFTAPDSFEGAKAWLQFDAASRTAEVWLNGQRLGAHDGAFSRFRLDATAALKPGQDNVLVVKTDNSKPQAGAATADSLPLAGDFFVHGGLYRPVSLIATNSVHIDMMDSGGSGAYATTRSITADQAQIDVEVRLRNDGVRDQATTVRIALVDAEGRVQGEVDRRQLLTANASDVFKGMITVARPRLWQGVADPYLYTLRTEVMDPTGAVIDRVDQPYGVRQIVVDPEQGFLLNGQKVRLVGTGYHQDREGKGWAVTPADIEEDVAMLRDMGVNTLRLTHYQHGQTVHDLADRYGLIVWDEIPLVSVWTLGGAKDPSEGLRANARQQLTELIQQNRNHASVSVWGIANEVDFGNSLPIFLTGDASSLPDPLPLLHELDALAKKLDPSRHTTLATCCEARHFAEGVTVPATAVAADLGGMNLYYGWYYDGPSDLAAALDSVRQRRPEQPLAITEYGAGGATTMHTDNPLGGPIDSRGRAQPEEYESYIHEQAWSILAPRDYLWGTWLWNGFDFATTIRREGDADDINTKGLITYDRKIKKDAYFFYRANWSSNPTVHVTASRYTDRAYQHAEVRVYSNAASTALVLNGQTLAAQADCPMRICVWPVKLSEGVNTVEAVGRFADGEVRDDVRWTLGEDVARAVRIDSGAILAAPSVSGRFGSDNFFSGGRAGSADPAPVGFRPATPVDVEGDDPALIKTYRTGTFDYAVPVDAGTYEVTLTFLEPTAGPGERLFDVRANGDTVLAGFDVNTEAGGVLKVVKRKFEATAQDGRIVLSFAPTRGDALVSAIEIVKK